MNKTLCLLDFDGTISDQDSLSGFTRFAVGSINYYWGLVVLSPMLVGYVLGLIPNDVAKERLISYFFKGWEYSEFDTVATEFSEKELNKLIRPRALEAIQEMLKQGHTVVVVTASVENWLAHWCARYQLHLIGTQLEVYNGNLTGKFATKNCYGVEKVKRIKELFDLEEYHIIYAFGDSKGDKEMLELAHHPYFKPFH